MLMRRLRMMGCWYLRSNFTEIVVRINLMAVQLAFGNASISQERQPHAQNFRGLTFDMDKPINEN